MPLLRETLAELPPSVEATLFQALAKPRSAPSGRVRPCQLTCLLIQLDAATVVPNLHAPSGQLRLPGRASAVICIATAAVASNDADDAVAAAAPRR